MIAISGHHSSYLASYSGSENIQIVLVSTFHFALSFLWVNTNIIFYLLALPLKVMVRLLQLTFIRLETFRNI